MSRIAVWGVPALLAAGIGQATVVERVTLEELVERSTRIVQGRCVRTWAAWDSATRLIWTHSELQITDELKGSRTPAVVVSEPGGVLDGVGMAVEGVPHYRPGEEVVVFLYRTPLGQWRTRGLGQGKFTLTPDRRVKTTVSGAALVSPQGVARPRGLEQEQLDQMGVDEFLGRVRALVLQRPQGAR